MDRSKVLNDATVREVQCPADDPCAKCKENSKHNGDNPDFGELPFHRAFFRVRIVVSMNYVNVTGDIGKTSMCTYATATVARSAKRAIKTIKSEGMVSSMMIMVETR